jgi:hypothetical protein
MTLSLSLFLSSPRTQLVRLLCPFHLFHILIYSILQGTGLWYPLITTKWEIDLCGYEHPRGSSLRIDTSDLRPGHIYRMALQISGLLHLYLHCEVCWAIELAFDPSSRKSMMPRPDDDSLDNPSLLDQYNSISNDPGVFRYNDANQPSLGAVFPGPTADHYPYNPSTTPFSPYPVSTTSTPFSWGYPESHPSSQYEISNHTPHPTIQEYNPWSSNMRILNTGYHSVEVNPASLVTRSSPHLQANLDLNSIRSIDGGGHAASHGNVSSKSSEVLVTYAVTTRKKVYILLKYIPC